MTQYWSDLLPSMPADRAWNINQYGPALQANKAHFWASCSRVGVRGAMCALLLAMAMLETNTLSPAERDTSKDGREDGAENLSMFNLNVDMVRRLGYQGEDPRELNAPDALPAVIGYLDRGAREWGVDRMLNYVRGGWTAFIDGYSYGAWAYRNAVATILRRFDADPELLHDDRRVDVHLEHV